METLDSNRFHLSGGLIWNFGRHDRAESRCRLRLGKHETVLIHSSPEAGRRGRLCCWSRSNTAAHRQEIIRGARAAPARRAHSRRQARGDATIAQTGPLAALAAEWRGNRGRTGRLPPRLLRTGGKMMEPRFPSISRITATRRSVMCSVTQRGTRGRARLRRTRPKVFKSPEIPCKFPALG